MSKNGNVENVHKAIREVASRVLTGDRLNYKTILATPEGEYLIEMVRAMIREEDGARMHESAALLVLIGIEEGGQLAQQVITGAAN